MYLSTVHDCWQQWSRGGTASRRPGSEQSHGTTEREDRCLRRMAMAHIVLGQFRARRPIACIPLTPNHCRLRREWCQTSAHWRTEWRYVVFSDESRFCLGASDGCVLAKRRPGERLQPTCPRPKHTGPTPGIMVWGAISYDSRSTLMVIPRTLTENLYVSLVIQPVVLPFMNSIQGGCFPIG
ncbi:hypothetical protein AVEN_218154-1 [Araneus ventricosus]|uniref:Transposase Tc1-like domain-containing protein n=1 Tax=Araneus ventricosus TaxID=182803 RepID=A0A4Y2FTU5_ARAVE|nr:hypothetical protein AVEN_218154-1 [Araneus ventricosus]